MYQRQLSPEHRQKISNAMKGKKHTDQTKQKISNAIKAKWMETTPTQTTQPTEPTTSTGKNKSFMVPDKDGKSN